MPDATHTPDLTIEEQLRAAQGVLLLVAELFELYSFTPRGRSRHGFSAAASATVAALAGGRARTSTGSCAASRRERPTPRRTRREGPGRDTTPLLDP